MASLAHDLTGSGSDVAFGFSYTPASQITARSISNTAYVYQPAQDATAYVNNGLNQATSAGGVTLVWNTQGNLTSDGVRPFTYDAANRLTGTTGSALTYDPLDRLYQMTGTDGGRFQYDGAQVAAVYPAGSTTAAERYIAGPGQDEWAAVYTGAGTGSAAWPLQDQQGSVIALTDAAGAATSVLAYDEYGRPRAGNAGRFQYTGQMMLPDYGLQHYKARAYHAGLGRFVQTDPVGYEQGLNLYAYVANDPVNATDPTGLREVNLSGSQADREEFVKLVASTTGLSVSEQNGKLVSPDTSASTFAGGVVLDAINSSDQLDFNIVSNDARTFIDSASSMNVDVGDISSMAAVDSNLGAATLTHVFAERMDMAQGASYESAHANALGLESQALGAVGRFGGLSGFTPGSSFNPTYISSSGGVVASYRFRLDATGTPRPVP